jgi:para-aminobenzoate synthetase/4-amino-4-deoxychorismate lyase
MLLRRRAQPVEIAAGVDESAAHRARAPEQAAILLERRDRYDSHPHRGIGHARQIESGGDRGNTGLPRRSDGGMRIAMALPAPPFVLLDDARPGGAAARLYMDPVEIVCADTPEQVLPTLEALRAARARGLHAAGYIRYEAAAGIEPKLAHLAAPGPLLWFGLFAEYREVEPHAVLPDPAGAWAGAPRPAIERDIYAERFAHVAECIQAGDIYQANLTFRAEVATMGSPAAVYALLRDRAAAGYGALIATGAEWLLSFSPELFFALEAGILSARPMKGTALRDADPVQDAANAAELRAYPKQRAENLMIVDLLRNDLSRVARPGSVAVPRLFHVEHYPTVHQMVSEITATLDPERDAIDALAALFPCGSITGAPKLRAMEIIAETEDAPRGVYTGAIGRLDANGDAMFNVAIRTLTLTGGDSIAVLGLGSGVVADSDPEQEWQECLAKGAFVTAGERKFDLIETMRFDPLDGMPYLERHLSRMKDSAAVFGFAFDRHTVRNELQAATFRLRTASKVRLLLARSGAISIGISPLPDAPEQPVRVALRPLEVAPDDFRLRHKTSRRGFYDRARADSGAWEVVFTDPEGFLTEGSFTNIFVERDGKLLTPPLARGLLPGVLRAELIAIGAAVEHDLRPADLAGGFQLGNALRGLVSAVTVAERANANV